VGHIADVLRGSQNQRIVQRRHQRLSTYGTGSSTKKRDWNRLANEFISQGLIEQDMGYGSLRITAKGQAVLQGGQVLIAPAEVPVALDRVQMDQRYDAVLFERLRALRRRLADQANVPPYVVFSDRSLVEMATYFPQSPASLLAIDGVGQHKLQNYGEAFLAVLRAYCREHGIAEGNKAQSAAKGPGPRLGGGRRFEEVGDDYAAGHSIERLQVFYGVQRGTIITHLCDYAAAGIALDPARLRAESRLSPDDQARVLAALAKHGPAQLRPIYDELGGTVPYDELHLMRLVYRLTDSQPAG
jgi:ATP-dependent DNA helicase RecQ